MKKIITLLFATSLFSLGQAQEANPAPANNQMPKPTPEQIATRQSTHLQKRLGLTDEQKQKTYQAVLTRTAALQAIHEKYGENGDKKAMRKEAKPIRQQYVQTMTGILTPEQKTKWDEQRLKTKEAHMKHRQQENAPPPPKEGSSDPKKLMDDDDGID
jgi:hypothetical protein